MLRLRKILLCDYLYITILIISLLITIYRINISKESNYNESSNTFTGIITKIIIKDDNVRLYIKNKETVIGTFYLKDDNNFNFKLGDKIKIEGEFIKPSSNTSEYLFNYKKYLERDNIFYLVKIKSIKRIKSNRNIYYFLKQKLINRLGTNSYLHTFILGDKSYLDRDVKISYQENGISHLFAISGMHISMLVLIIGKFFSKRDEKTLFFITTNILIIYLLIVGPSSSILRAVLFYILFSINNINYFYIKPTNLFFLIVSISLFINPYYIYDIGYLYSYSISFALIKLKPTSNNYFFSLFKVSMISLLVSIPITLYNFYMINILSVLYNLVFVPLVSIIIFPLSLIVVFIKPLEPILNLLIKLLEGLSLALNKISFSKLIFIRLPIYVYIIYFLIIVIYLYRPKKVFLTIFFSLLFIHFLIPYFDNRDYIKVIDVGQGDSILIHSRGEALLLDTGGVPTYSDNDGMIFHNTLKPILRSNGIRKINALVLSHGDKDHAGEAVHLVNNILVEKVIFNCGDFNYLEKELIKELNSKHIKYYSCINRLDIGSSKLQFLQTKDFNDENDNSNVIYSELNGYKFMFMGDASSKTEKEIIDTYNLEEIDVLKVGHHGSRTSSSKKFIKTINPKYSLISAGRNNKFNHPHKEVLDNLKTSKIYRTDKQGTVTLKLKNNKLKIETFSP